MKQRIGSLAATLLITAGMVFAQAKPAFEVAVIKPAAPLDMAKLATAIQAGEMPKIGAHVDGDRAEYTYVALRDLIALAWRVQPYQVSGPDWLANTRFDIVAKIPAGAARDDVPAMLQSLLEDRFRLSAHKSSAEHPVLALVVAKGGPRLKESAEKPVALDDNAPLAPGQMKMEGPEGPVRMTVGKNGAATIDMGAKGKMSYRVDAATQSMHLDGSMITMSGFANMLTQLSQMAGAGSRRIVDMTGLTGYYQVSIDFGLADLLNMVRAAGFNVPLKGPGAPADGASDPGGSSSITDAVNALGLRLESRKAVVEQLIVDQVAKVPTAN